MIIDRADNVLDVVTMSEKGMSGRRYDQSLDLGEFDALKRLLEWCRRHVLSPLSHLQRV